MDLHETFREGWQWRNEQMIKRWWQSGSWTRIATLVRRHVHGITDTLLRRLQAVQNAAARVVSGTRRCDHISPRQLYWLPVRQRVDFKLAMLVYKALNDLAPQYLSEDCQLVAATSRQQLRSSGNFKCTLTSTSTRLGDRAFAAAEIRRGKKKER